MSRAFVDEDFTPIDAPLHGTRADAERRAAEIVREREIKFAAQDARLAAYASRG